MRKKKSRRNRTLFITRKQDSCITSLRHRIHNFPPKNIRRRYVHRIRWSTPTKDKKYQLSILDFSIEIFIYMNWKNSGILTFPLLIISQLSTLLKGSRKRKRAPRRRHPHDTLVITRYIYIVSDDNDNDSNHEVFNNEMLKHSTPS